MEIILLFPPSLRLQTVIKDVIFHICNKFLTLISLSRGGMLEGLLIWTAELGCCRAYSFQMANIDWKQWIDSMGHLETTAERRMWNKAHLGRSLS